MAGSKFVPPPTTLLNTWANWIVGIGEKDQYTGSCLSHAVDSLYRVLIGFTIAAACGVTLGVTIGWFRLAAKLIDPVVQILRPIPITAWVPLAVVFFGIRNGSAFFLIALGAFFPIVVNTAAGVQRTPLLLVRTARMPGIWPYMLLPRVVLPAFVGLANRNWLSFVTGFWSCSAAI